MVKKFSKFSGYGIKKVKVKLHSFKNPINVDNLDINEIKLSEVLGYSKYKKI